MWTLALMLLAAACLFSLGVALWVICSHFFIVHIPAAIGHPVKLRVLHCIFQLLVTWREPSVNTNHGYSLLTHCILHQLWAPGSMAETHHGICSRLCKESDSVVLAVGYRKLPKYKCPVSIRDCLAATIHFLRSLHAYGVDPARVVVCGDSLGGGLATVVCQKLVNTPDLPRIRAQILIYAILQVLDFQTPSFQQRKNIPMLCWSFTWYCLYHYLDISSSWQEVIMKGAHLPAKVWEKYRKWLGPENIPERFKSGYQQKPHEPVNEAAYLELSVVLDVMCSPLIAEDDIVSQLPEACIVSCEYDTLRDSSLLYKKRLEDLGVPVTWHHVEDGFHGVLNTIDLNFLYFPSSTRILNVLTNFIKGL
ncbi:arylacetamide deacetylase-like 3 [Cebus imitator]|uniref:arylacetamide deacetylase-like 3 n=1 Tax=Cebus imitator TaxID=2715852 RepID=UPI00189756F4|nr:arylacetamide deacetylase-like 3 [Cebus imitator]